MSKKLPFALPLAVLAITAQAQDRYLNEVFTPAQVTVTNDVTFGTNIDFFYSNFSNPALAGPEVVQLQTAVTMGTPIPPAFFNPNDAGTVVKVVDLKMDVYQPDQGADSEAARPVFIFVHTGNALPPPRNGSPMGTRKDSSAVEICKQMARRGYVAVSMSYRLGWNPISTDPDVRRGTLLNAIYRAIHDVKQCVRNLKADAAGANTYAIDPTKVILYGEGTGGYITLATATLDKPSELFIEKFIPNPLQNPDSSYVDTLKVGNIEGFGGQLTLYRPNGFDSHINFCVNAGGSLADSSWLEPGDVPMLAFQTVFDPFAPFGAGTVIVPTTGEQVVDVHGSNVFMPLVNTFGNNSSFATLPNGNPYTDRARSLYNTNQVHGSTTVHINDGAEGLFPFVTPNWPAINPATLEEAGPWQWWDPNGPLANIDLDGDGPGTVTTGQASQASNPNFSGTKGRAYIDTIMGYMNPRLVCALQLGPCSLVGISESDPVAQGVGLFPNPAHELVHITSSKAVIRMVEVYDVNGRRVRAENVDNTNYLLQRDGLMAGAYFVTLTFDQGTVTRKLMLD